VVYNRCDNTHCTAPVPSKLNVHLVPHTHDDVGWLKTVDQYYYGSQSETKKAGVQYIIESVIQSLLRAEHRRFIYVETSFFWMWWREQDEDYRHQVRKLVNEGRLEFISGGWVMHDEANTHYQSIIDQMTWGHRRLQDMIGQCVVPRIGWQIDPFGHSRESAHLSAMFGFDGLFFARLDYEDQKLRSAEKRMEFIWEGSDDIVLDPTGAPVNQTYVFPIPAPVLRLKERVSEAVEELVFEASVPALGFATYILKRQDTEDSLSAPVVRTVDRDFSVQTPGFNVFFDGNGRLQELQFRDSGRTVSLRQEFAYYRSFGGNNYGPYRASGAYVFRPDRDEADVIHPSDGNYRARVVESPVLTEVHHDIKHDLSQVIRIDHRSDAIEFDYTCGPISVADMWGKEVVFRWQTNLTTGGKFYTDSNGRQTMRRRRNYRPTYNLTITQPVSGNYYPVTNWIAIRDEAAGLQLTMLNDRAQGGTGFREGQIELMVHRRILHDDGMGVKEPLNEPGVDGNGLAIRGRFWLQLATLASATELHREAANRLMMEPVMTFRRVAEEPTYYHKEHRTNYSALYSPLPRNIHLLTLEQWANRTLLLRLEHFYQWNESREWSTPVRVELRDLFREFVVYDVLETTLSA
ncbi:unnamed protein product, partial [Medioppia subpectinata]